MSRRRKKELDEQERKDVLECPLCGKRMFTLKNHIIMKHGLTQYEIFERFPKLQLHVDKRKEDNIKCSICDKTFKFKNGYSIHMKKVHNIDINKKDAVLVPKIRCNICNTDVNNLTYHLKYKHNINVEDYKKEFNYEGPLLIFSETHKNNLSKNKKAFYNESERGLELKRELSKKVSGDNNPGCDPIVKKKISNAAVRRIKENNNINGFYSNSYGIRIKFKFENTFYSVRSLEEFKCLYTLLNNGIKFEYENTIINYKIEDNSFRTYLLDLKINDLYIEIKGTSEKRIEEYYSISQYNLIYKHLQNLNKRFYIMNYKMLCDFFSLEEYTEEYFFKVLHKMLIKDECKIQQTLSRENTKPVKIEKIDLDYMNNRNIKISIKKSKI